MKPNQFRCSATVYMRQITVDHSESGGPALISCFELGLPSMVMDAIWDNQGSRENHRRSRVDHLGNLRISRKRHSQSGPWVAMTLFYTTSTTSTTSINSILSGQISTSECMPATISTMYQYCNSAAENSCGEVIHFILCIMNDPTAWSRVVT